MSKQIKIQGYKDAEIVEAILSSHLVDVVYFVEEKNKSVILDLDDGINPSNKKDINWLYSVINQTLTENSEQEVTVECI